jgi:hypothetical protein
MITLIQDLRYAWRTLLKNPGFTAVAVLTLALGIGANTAVFSVLDAVVLRPLPYPQPDKLVSVQCRDPRTGLSQNLSYPDFFDFRGQNHVFEHLVTYRDDHFTLTGFGPALDPQVPVFDVRTVDDLVSLEITQPHFQTLLLSTFAGMALLLTIVGLYGVTAYSVARRTREIGLRIALGATRSTVLSMVLKQALRLVVFGVLLGLTGALAATRLLRDMLYGVQPLDPVVFAIACLLIALTGVLAAYLPARRAAQVDPIIALRYE